ncbi:hypothetical protein FBQ95_16995 [Chloroflexi bacterium CFX3]|nr:hypothetical protein [Chloroflexi bacterium CFX3]
MLSKQSVGSVLAKAFGLYLPDENVVTATRGICALCGAAGDCIPAKQLIVVSTSEIPDIFRAGDALCTGCAAAFKASNVLIGSLLATHDGEDWYGCKPTVSMQPDRPRWRDVVYTLPYGTPTVALLTSNTKRRLWHRAILSVYSEAWRQNDDAPLIAPVIQFRRAKHFDSHWAYQQALRYRPYLPFFPRIAGKAVLFLSNPALRAEQCETLPMLCQMIRAAYGSPLWLHWLGGGWDVADIRAYAQMNALDSLDSIAYYTDAMSGIAWQADGSKQQSFEYSPEALSIRNAEIASAAAVGL